MSPPRAVSAPSGDLFWSRPLRAPEDEAGFRGELFGYFLAAQKVTRRQAKRIGGKQIN